MKKTIIAFTLAEVLIVIGIIGLIAEFTLPELINNFQEQIYKTSYKKAYSALSQVYSMIVAENNWTIKGAFSTPNEFRDLFLSKMSYIKKCDWAEVQGGCWNSIGAYTLTGQTIIGGGSGWWFYPSVVGAVLKDGTSLIFDVNYDVYQCNNSAATYPECARAFIDTNGLKPPNRAGKDILWIYIYEDRMKPFGNGTSCTGFNCSSYYLMN